MAETSGIPGPTNTPSKYPERQYNTRFRRRQTSEFEKYEKVTRATKMQVSNLMNYYDELLTKLILVLSRNQSMKLNQRNISSTAFGVQLNGFSLVVSKSRLKFSTDYNLVILFLAFNMIFIMAYVKYHGVQVDVFLEQLEGNESFTIHLLTMLF